MTSILKKNIMANFTGSAWQTLMSLVFIPLYIKFLGIESWGLVGIFATLQIIFGLLDVGLSSTLNREVARLSVLPNREQTIRNLVRTLELIYWGIAGSVGACIAGLSPFIAHNWINAGQLPPDSVERAVLIMGFVLAFQMPIGFYAGGLMGLQKQVLLNGINMSAGTFRGVGSVLVLWLLSPTIQAFFLWQIVACTINTMLLAAFLRRSLPRCDSKASFQPDLIRGIWRFATGMSGITILAVFLTQLDKIVLSRMLTLEMFGYYTLASIVALSLGRISMPVFNSIYPRFTQLFCADDQKALTRLYHEVCQFMAVMVLPAAVVIAFFSYEILFLWTQNSAAAEKAHILVSILVCGTALNGLLHPPYAIQLASGWTRLSLLKNVIAVIALAPLIIFMSKRYGAIGGAFVWALLNVGYFLFEIPLMHRKLLRPEKWRWYWQDVSVPLFACVITAAIARLFLNQTMSQWAIFIYLVLVYALTLCAAMMVTPAMRSWLTGQLARVKWVYGN